MARIVKKATERRKEIIDKAQNLFYNLGYEKTSVALIIKELNISKGAFYHHFASKLELLDEIADQFSDAIILQLNEIVESNILNALEKLNGIFQKSVAFKTDNIELICTILKTFYSDNNLLLREKLNERNLAKTIPIFTQIITQGKNEGFFNIEDSESIAKIILLLGIGISNSGAKIYGELKENPEKINDLKKMYISYQTALERILGAPKDSIYPIDFSIIEKIKNHLESS